mmetsp:Transcript_50726/g.93833  ORF Transcript_50726/g.93833 Transcript_50726/m.93833 type:complete len:410 (+) Transcript_50726:2978-4207(+)
MHWARLANQYPRHLLKHPRLQKALRPFRLFQALLLDQTPLDLVLSMAAIPQLQLLHLSRLATQHLQHLSSHPVALRLLTPVVLQLQAILVSLLEDQHLEHLPQRPHLHRASQQHHLSACLLVDQTPLDLVRLMPAMLRLRLLHFALSAMQHLERFRHHPHLRMSSHFHSYSGLALPLQQILDIWFRLMYLARLASQHPGNLQKRPHLHRALHQHRSTSRLLLDQTPLALHLALLASQRPKRVPDHPLPHISAPHHHLCSRWLQDQTPLGLPLEMFLPIAAVLLLRPTLLALLANQPPQPPPEHSRLLHRHLALGLSKGRCPQRQLYPECSHLDLHTWPPKLLLRHRLPYPPLLLHGWEKAAKLVQPARWCLYPHLWPSPSQAHKASAHANTSCAARRCQRTPLPCLAWH